MYLSDSVLLERAAQVCPIQSADVPGWNPLQDDGACAQLETALMLNVEWREASVCVYCEHTLMREFFEDHQGDKAAARRRAVVRAAAELFMARERHASLFAVAA